MMRTVASNKTEQGVRGLKRGISAGCCLLIFLLSTIELFAAVGNVVCRVETDRRILPAGGSQTAIIKVTLDAPPPPKNYERTPVNLSLVLDRSGSMGGEKIERAKDAAVEAVRRLGRRDVFSLVTYDSQIDTVIPALRVYRTGGIERQIEQIQPGGNTALFGGVSQGAAEVRKNLEGDYVHRIILLSDGLANVGPSSPRDLGRLGAALLKENISVTTIGVGTDYNEDLMARLSQQSDGNIYFVESSRDLPHIFTAELGDVLSVVAQKVKLTIELPATVRPIRIIGREGRIRDRRVLFSMNQLYGDQEKYALVEVEISGAVAGERMEIARARVHYENPFTGTQEVSHGKAVASFSRHRDRIFGSTNTEVVREYQLNLNALAQEKAISLSDRGMDDDAVRELKKSAEKMKDIGGRYKDPNLVKEAEELEMQAEALEREGMTKKRRKLLRTRSSQQIHQQASQ